MKTKSFLLLAVSLIFLASCDSKDIRVESNSQSESSSVIILPSSQEESNISSVSESSSFESNAQASITYDSAKKLVDEYFDTINTSLYGYNGLRTLNKIKENEYSNIDALTKDELANYTTSLLEESVSKVKKLDEAKSANLFLSEIFNLGYDKDINPTGNNNDKAIELYNPLESEIDLSKYHIEIYSSGLDEIKNESYYISLSGTLNSNSSYLIVNNYAAVNLKAKANLITSVYLGAKSSVALFYNDEIIDSFGYIGKSYISNDEYVINGVSSALDNKNVIRKPSYMANYEFLESEWEVSFNNDYSTLGNHNFKESSYEDVLNELIEYYQAQEVTGDIELIYDLDGYTFTYDFYDYYYDANGHMKIEPEDGFTLSFVINMYKGDTLLKTTYDAYVTYKR